MSRLEGSEQRRSLNSPRGRESTGYHMPRTSAFSRNICDGCKGLHCGISGSEKRVSKLQSHLVNGEKRRRARQTNREGGKPPLQARVDQETPCRRVHARYHLWQRVRGRRWGSKREKSQLPNRRRMGKRSSAIVRKTFTSQWATPAKL